MLIRCATLLLFAGGLLLAAGCQTTPSASAAQSEYQPPPKGAESGFFLGARRRVGFLADDHLGYALLVDRKFVANPKKSWNKPLALSSGRHVITTEYIYGPYVARADIVLEVKPGASYQLRIMNGTEGGEGGRFNDFWIVDSAGAVVSQVYHSAVSGGSNYNPFSVY